jgi:hypothetical protein
MISNNKTKALQLESRFSMPPNSLGYCGRDTAKDAFRTCLLTGNCDPVAKEITHFIVLHPYLKTIAEVTGLKFTDYKVIESYWIGNELMNQFKPEHYDILIKNLAKQGVPDWLIDEIKDKKPKKFVPVHLFNILHVGVGRASGAVEFNTDSVNHCMIRWGKVTHLDTTSHKLTVNLTSLNSHTPPYKFVTASQTYSYEPELLKDMKLGSTVAVHWHQVIKVLTPTETKNLKHWTQQLLNSLS